MIGLWSIFAASPFFQKHKYSVWLSLVYFSFELLSTFWFFFNILHFVNNPIYLRGFPSRKITQT